MEYLLFLFVAIPIAIVAMVGIASLATRHTKRIADGREAAIAMVRERAVARSVDRSWDITVIETHYAGRRNGADIFVLRVATKKPRKKVVNWRIEGF